MPVAASRGKPRLLGRNINYRIGCRLKRSGGGEARDPAADLGRFRNLVLTRQIADFRP
jgi:hypothetical protein